MKKCERCGNPLHKKLIRFCQKEDGDGECYRMRRRESRNASYYRHAEQRRIDARQYRYRKRVEAFINKL